MWAEFSKGMSLYTKPSEFYAELKNRPDFLQVLVWSETLAKNIIDLSLRSDDELSEWVTRESALAEQSDMIAKSLCDTFSEHTKALFADMSATSLNWQGVKFWTIDSLIEAMQDVIAYSTRDAKAFVTNFAKDPKLLDKEYFVNKLGVTNVVFVDHTIYDNKGQETFEYTDPSLPDNFYLAGKKLIRWDDDTREMMPVLYKDRPIVPSYFFSNKEVQFAMIDKKRGIFVVSDDGSVDKSWSVNDYELEYYTKEDRYMLFKNTEGNLFMVDKHYPCVARNIPNNLSNISSVQHSISRWPSHKIGDVSFLIMDYYLDHSKMLGQAVVLYNDTDGSDFQCLLVDKKYNNLTVIQVLQENNMFLVDAERAENVCDYYAIFTDGSYHLLGTVWENLPIKRIDAKYDRDTHSLSVYYTVWSWSAAWDIWYALGRLLKRKSPTHHTVDFDLAKYTNNNIIKSE